MWSDRIDYGIGDGWRNAGVGALADRRDAQPPIVAHQNRLGFGRVSLSRDLVLVQVQILDVT